MTGPLEYLRVTNRPPDLIALVEAYAKEQGIFLDARRAPTLCTTTRSNWISSKVTPSLAGPKRPQDRIDLKDVKKNFLHGLG